MLRRVSGGFGGSAKERCPACWLAVRRAPQGEALPAADIAHDAAPGRVAPAAARAPPRELGLSLRVGCDLDAQPLAQLAPPLGAGDAPACAAQPHSELSARELAPRAGQLLRPLRGDVHAA